MSRDEDRAGGMARSSPPSAPPLRSASLPPRRSAAPPWASSRVMALRWRLATAPSISVFLDIGQGAGLAGASGVRPFLPPLLAGALARADAGIDFDGTDLSFLESPWFLLAVLAAAVGAYAAEAAGR